MKRRITLSSEGRRLVEDAVNAGKKIAAIKALRIHGKAFPNEESIGLREAKQALEAEYYDGDADSAEALIGPSFIVKKIVIEVCGEGTVEVDIEELQLRFLSEMKALGLDEVAKLLKLTEYIRDWQR